MSINLERGEPTKKQRTVYRRLQQVALETATNVDTRDKNTFMMTLGSWMEIADQTIRELKTTLQICIDSCKNPGCDLCVKAKQVIHKAEKIERTGEGEDI